MSRGGTGGGSSHYLHITVTNHSSTYTIRSIASSRYLPIGLSKPSFPNPAPIGVSNHTATFPLVYLLTLLPIPIDLTNHPVTYPSVHLIAQLPSHWSSSSTLYQYPLVYIITLLPTHGRIHRFLKLWSFLAHFKI